MVNLQPFIYGIIGGLIVYLILSFKLMELGELAIIIGIIFILVILIGFFIIRSKER